MNKIINMCSYCSGVGYTEQWFTPYNDGSNNFYMEQKTCPCCNGTGKQEFALFTIEEANAILEFCGLKKNEYKE